MACAGHLRSPSPARCHLFATEASSSAPDGVVLDENLPHVSRSEITTQFWGVGIPADAGDSLGMRTFAEVSAEASWHAPVGIFLVRSLHFGSPSAKRVETGFAGAASFSVSCEQTWLGFFMFVTAISFRMVALDFSIAGSLASGLALLFAIPSMFLALWWTVHG